MQENGHHAILSSSWPTGWTGMFGNPGTVEQGFLDALADYPGPPVHPDAAGDESRS